MHLWHNNNRGDERFYIGWPYRITAAPEFLPEVCLRRTGEREHVFKPCTRERYSRLRIGTFWTPQKVELRKEDLAQLIEARMRGCDSCDLYHSVTLKSATVFVPEAQKKLNRLGRELKHATVKIASPSTAVAKPSVNTRSVSGNDVRQCCKYLV
jgi:hypothetical protein